MSPDQQIQIDVFGKRELTREEIQRGLSRDLRGLHVTLTEVLRSKECIDALTEVYYQRYLKLRADSESIPDPDAA